MRNVRFAITALGLPLLIGALGCSGTWRSRGALEGAAPATAVARAADATVGITDADAMRTAVAGLVPDGTSLAEAEARMTAEGFACSFDYDAVADRDSLRCTRTDAESLLVSRRWIVTFTYRDGRTTGVEVRTGALGL